jgi:hypothetical protein
MNDLNQYSVFIVGIISCLSVVNATPSGYYTGSGVNGDSNSCPFACNAGYTAAGRSCYPCAPGSYSGVSRSVCQACNAGYYSEYAGASSCKNCSAGNYSGSGASGCSRCATGFTSQEASSNCTALPCPVGYYGVDPQCNPCPANTNSSFNHTSTLLDCRCLAGFVCTYTKQISVVLTLNSITWDMTTIAGLSRNAIIDAIAQAAGVPREKVVISSMLSGRRLLRLLQREVLMTVHGAEGLDIDSVYRQLNVSHVSWTHRHSVHVARELI